MLWATKQVSDVWNKKQSNKCGKPKDFRLPLSQKGFIIVDSPGIGSVERLEEFHFMVNIALGYVTGNITHADAVLKSAVLKILDNLWCSDIAGITVCTARYTRCSALTLPVSSADLPYKEKSPLKWWNIPLRGEMQNWPPWKQDISHVAKAWQCGNTKAERLIRNENLRRIKTIDRKQWKAEFNYRYSRVSKTSFFCLKPIFGDRMSAPIDNRQITQLLLHYYPLNTMTTLGMPKAHVII